MMFKEMEFFLGKKCWYYEIDIYFIGDCVCFFVLDGEIKMELLKRNGVCFSCLKSGYFLKWCINRKFCEIIDFN